jgi:hypothetical protein
MPNYICGSKIIPEEQSYSPLEFEEGRKLVGRRLKSLSRLDITDDPIS